MKYLREFTPTVYFVLAVLVALVLGYLLFRDLGLDDKAKVKIEVIRALLSLPIVLILGGIVSQLFKYVDQRREDSNSLAVFREDLRKRLGEAYARAKECRRLLRMAGFTEEVFVKPIRKAPNLIEAYSCRMEVLNEVQLDLEKLWQEMDCFRCAFSSPDRLLKRVKIMSGYLRRLIDEYEENLPILKNSRDELSLSELKAL